MTRELAKRHNRPCLHVNLEATSVNDAATQVRKWIEMKHIRVLNIAGPRASKDPAIYQAAIELLETVFLQTENALIGAIKVLPQTADQAVEELLTEITLDNEIQIALIKEDALQDLHFSLAAYIRNHFRLWTGNEALMDSFRSTSGNQDLNVDDASMVIITSLWKRLKKYSILTES